MERGDLVWHSSTNDWKIIGSVELAAVTRHIAIVGPHRSRPAHPSHIAQAQQLTQSSGRLQASANERSYFFDLHVARAHAARRVAGKDVLPS